jgi:hypothetical protein
MILTAKNGRLGFSAYGEDVREFISFEVIPEGRGKITIGDKCVFGSSVFDSGNHEKASGRFTIEKKSSYRYKPDGDEMGYVKFFEENADEFSQYSSSALVSFHAFVDDVFFEKVKQGILHKLPVAYLTCSLEGMDYGWEPDGSHKLWKLKDGESEVSYSNLVDIKLTQFDIGYGNQFSDEYWEGRDEGSVSAPLVTSEDVELFKKQLKYIQYAVVFIAVAIIFLMLS